MNKADEKALGGLHGKLAEVLKDALSQPYADDQGNPVPPPAAILNVARQFLKDNKIEAIAATGSPLADLADLPIFEDDNIVHIRKAN
jgi:ABC-type branched-subunit amino acid transport system substrate-binding protein